MKKAAAFGWAIYVVGLALWFYGYMTAGHASLIDWQAHTPWWIADFLPNLEAEVGLLVMLVSMLPIYWPARGQVRESS